MTFIAAKSKEARSWQASCLKAHEEKSIWMPYFSTPTERQEIRDERCRLICTSIIDKVGQIAFDYNGKDADEKGLFDVVHLASDLSIKLGILQSGIELMDLKWFKENNLKFSSMDNRMELRACDEFSKRHMEGEVMVVLCPGLLKWGRDNGDNWESWSVWARARVELMEPPRVQQSRPNTKNQLSLVKCQAQPGYPNNRYGTQIDGQERTTQSTSGSQQGARPYQTSEQGYRMF